MTYDRAVRGRQDDAPVKVVFVAAWGRSGSTLLGNMLGQLDGWAHVGEICYAWERGLLEDWTCGCGVAFSACPLWTRVVSAAQARQPALDAATLARQALRLRTRHLPSMLSERGRARWRASLASYLEATERLYLSVRQATGARVIVDSSKNPAHAYALSLIPSVSLRVVHLLRDPRAAAHSWSARSGERPDRPASRPMARHSPLVSALRWDSWNVATEIFARARELPVVTLRYEDFVRAPQQALERICAAAGEAAPPRLVSEAGEVDLRPCHTISGNPSRLVSGTVAVRADEEWRQRMPRASRALVVALTWPLMLRHGYA